MKRKQITKAFPFLLPYRQKQQILYFYYKMHFDTNQYCKQKQQIQLPYEIINLSLPLIYKQSAYDIQYQRNKVYNIQLAAKSIHKILIKPGEVFSFWQLVRQVSQKAYKEGLSIINGIITASKGGGICQLSNLLFILFLHTPFSIIERHAHSIIYEFLSNQEEMEGVDAAVSQGFKDLKVKNNTKNTYQIILWIEDGNICGKILSQNPSDVLYEIERKDFCTYFIKNQQYKEVSIYQKVLEIESKEILEYNFLYRNKSRIIQEGM